MTTQTDARIALRVSGELAERLEAHRQKMEKGNPWAKRVTLSDVIRAILEEKLGNGK